MAPDRHWIDDMIAVKDLIPQNVIDRLETLRKERAMKASDLIYESEDGDRHVACGGLLRISKGQPVMWCLRCGDEIAVSIAGVPR